MAYTEKALQCADCGKTFAFTAEEQEFYASKQFTNEPKRCPDCRRATATEVPARCIPLPADNAANKQRYPFSLAATSRFSAEIAIPKADSAD